MTPWNLADTSLFCPEDSGSKFLRSPENYIVNGVTSQNTEFLFKINFGESCSALLKVFSEVTEDKRQNSVSRSPINSNYV
jgi:hypothetical protein